MAARNKKKLPAPRNATAKTASTRKPTAATARAVLRKLTQRELRLDLPQLGPMNPGLLWLWKEPETQTDGEGRALTVLGTNSAGLWFVLADDGSIHLVDDCERELGTRVFVDIAALAAELVRQNS